MGSWVSPNPKEVGEKGKFFLIKGGVGKKQRKVSRRAIAL